jgi:hypothetical protein
VWLGAGVLLGLWMVLDPARALPYRPAHMHPNLLGFVSMMIFGVAYHVIPRFTGAPLWSRRSPGLHLLLANAGLALMVAGWIGRVTVPAAGNAALRLGAVAGAAGAFLFIANIWQTLAPTRAASATPQPPTALGSSK